MRCQKNNLSLKMSIHNLCSSIYHFFYPWVFHYLNSSPFLFEFYNYDKEKQNKKKYASIKILVSSQEVFDRSEGVKPTFVNNWFHNN